MSKPIIFISSTYYDLKDARSTLSNHLKMLGMEPLIFESSNFGVTPGKNSHNAALDQVDNSDYFILLIGGKKGTNFYGTQKSITNQEYLNACKKGVPIFVFVLKEVWHAYEMYKKFPNNDYSSVVDDTNVFTFIESIASRTKDNWIKPFDNIEEVKTAITHQFAYILFLFSKSHVANQKPDNKKTSKSNEVIPFPSNIVDLGKYCSTEGEDEKNYILNGLKKIHELIEKIARGTQKGKDDKLFALWVIGRFGDRDTNEIHLKNDIFKDHAWSEYKGKRVAAQFEPFGVNIRYFDDLNYDGEHEIYLSTIGLKFSKDPDQEMQWALQFYIKKLIEINMNDDELAYKLFKNADMRFLST